MLSRSDPMPLPIVFANFMYAYKITPTPDKGAQVVAEIFKHFSSLSRDYLETSTQDYFLKELLTIEAPSNHAHTPTIENYRDRLITQLFIRTVPLAENLPFLMISTLDRTLLSTSHQERLFQPFVQMLSYHSREGMLTIERSQINASADEHSEIFWNTLRETFLTYNFETPRLKFIDDTKERIYQPFALTGFFNIRPLLSSFGKEFNLIFMGSEILVENYEILLSCGKWFSAFFQSGLKDTKSQEIDFRAYAPDMLIFKQGFQELVARVRNEKIKYPNTHLESLALRAYFHLTSFFIHVLTPEEEAGKEYLLKQFQQAVSSLCFEGPSLSKNIKTIIQTSASESNSLEELFDKLDPAQLDLITKLNIPQSNLSLPPEICRLPKLKTISLHTCDLRSLPMQINELKYLTSVEGIAIHLARPFALGENFKETKQPSNSFPSINKITSYTIIPKQSRLFIM